MNFKKYIVLFLFYFVASFVFAQEQENNYEALKFKNLSVKEGLSQSSVLSIIQDKKGFLWFGTRDGLNKYDGNEFKVFRQNPQDSTSLSNNFIKILYEDTKGNLWVGTVDGLNKYQPESDSFKKYFIKGYKNSNESNVIWDIIEDSGGYLWIGTEAGLKKFHIETDSFVELNHASTLLKSPIRSLLIVDKNQLWIKTTDQVGVYNMKTYNVKLSSYKENYLKELIKSSVSVLYQDQKKNIWLGFNSGLAMLNKRNNKFEYFVLKSNEESPITGEVRTIWEDYLGNLWVGTYNGLYILNPDRSRISRFMHDENNSNSLSQNSIYKIYEDIKGDIWIGTYAGGVSYYDRSFDVFKHFPSGTNNTKLNYKVVSSIVEDENNNLWIGTEGGGINFYDSNKGIFKYYTSNSNDSNSLSANNVKAIIQDHAGNFWIGTHDGGLNFLNPNKRPFKFIKYLNNPNRLNSLSNNRVISLFEDCQHNIWIGTSGGGLNVLNNKTKTITPIVDNKNVLGDIVHVITQTSDKNHLLLGGGNGLAKININTNQLDSINYLGTNKTEHNSGVVLSIYEDKNNHLWIGTEGNGLFYYKGESSETTKFNSNNGLPNDVIYGIVPDNNNHIWLSTNNGLSRINLESLKIKNFDESDGLQGNEFNYGAYLKNKKGELLFGGANGFNLFNPSEIIENTFVPPVTITSFNVNNKPYIKITDSTKKIILKHTQNVFNFDFVATSYSQPNKNQYAYKLEGFDKEWNYIGNKKSATYTNLDDGDYVFKVKASNNDGLWNEKGASIPITILPAPWQTWWAYLLYTLLFIGVILIFRKYSLIRIRERNELKQERLEKERIEEVNKLKLELFTNISHDFRTPLTLILGPLERLLKVDNKDNFIKEQHEIMYRNASTLMELINQLLDFRKSESGKLQLCASKKNIVPFVNDIKLAFEGLARSKNIDFTLKASNDVIDVWFDQTKLKKIIFNLLSNAFKFIGEEGEISIDISTEDKLKKEGSFNYVKIKVSDNGKGISKANRKFIFDRFYQLGERSGTGIGLALTKNLVELHQGFIKVKSHENKGTTFIVQLPLGKEHLSKEEIVDDTIKSEQDTFYNIEKAAYVEKEIIALKKQNNNQDISIDNTLPSILIVEDNVEVRTFITSIFKGKYNVFDAENGKDAIEIAKSQDINLIISDIMMPVMDGVEMCNELKTNIKTSHIPVILLTAKTSQEAKKTGYQIGADAYITKPFDANILEIRVVNLLKSRKSLIDKFKKEIILQPKELTVTSADEMFLQKAIDILEQNLSNPEFGIANFIEDMGASRSVLYRKLKALTGQSISEFIKNIKLKRAAQLIKQTDMSISEIAFDLGFNDLKHFRKSFKKAFNTLPSQYRDSTSI
ncbi:two-component regulator propeller domain-containing protein [Flavivirga sp. 57AJ16]|uniref:two-component regulator propeller domain-containing protein n=1 Tax=Flavivirga sp. 57AJ16 TaxID=3025307 RepID=UPI0023652CDD|nr:two-component regulator propeller domain-containing protein [Flavivirga sp. 57AJ16]MDD7887835.1 two-component regulator propeller domain-containing protein [Flavivirga sp. 57AJ16]